MDLEQLKWYVVLPPPLATTPNLQFPLQVCMVNTGECVEQARDGRLAALQLKNV